MARISLPNGCSCSQPNVYPSNWKAVGASCKKDWYITYRFFDPAFAEQYPGGKLVMVKGMNGYKTVKDRQVSTTQILKELLYYLQEKGYNPILDAFVAEKQIERTGPIMPEDGLWRGIIFARTKQDGQYRPATRVDVDSYLRRILKAAQRLGLHTKPLGEFRRRDLLAILDEIGSQKAWSAHSWNHCLGYIKPLFSILIQYEAMESNPCAEIKKLPKPATVRATLTPSQRQAVNEHLRQHHRRFWLFVQIFFHSGARIIELLGLRREDVDIDAQAFWVTTRKGKSKVPRRTPKVIKDVALPYWEEYLRDMPAGEYLFAKNWQPGAVPYTRWHVTSLWRDIVKKGLGINADLYSLKHLHYDETDAMLGAEYAAAAAGHATVEMSKHYAVTKTQRELERVKKLRNAFA